MSKRITLFFYTLLFTAVQITTAQTPQLWGLTYKGGKYNDGAIIKINEDGSNPTVVYSFNASSGIYPSGDLLQAANGKFYGLTAFGGIGLGDIFSYAPSDTAPAIVHYFSDTDGAEPLGSLVQAANGKLYGATASGGAYGFGVLFSLDPVDNNYVNLHDFDSVNGATPYYGALIQASNGKLYGMTVSGGTANKGILFSFNISDSTFTNLLNFNGANGAAPYGSLLQASDGKLYGMTETGGVHNKGVLFNIDTLGITYNDLYDFIDSTGSNPHGSLIQATDGKLYGMTTLGGADSGGVIFNFNLSTAAYAKLYNMDKARGIYPYGSLIQAGNGNFYGMAKEGGNDTLKYGTLFSFNVSDTSDTAFELFNSNNGQWPFGNLIEIISTGINQLSINNYQLSVYPNPGSGEVTIASQKNIDELIVTNLFGQLIYRAQPKQTRYTFNIKQTGMYFVTITSANQTTTRKIVVAR